MRNQFALIGILLGLSPAPLLAAPQPAHDERPKIMVTGEAVVQVRPDRVVVRAAVETVDLDVASAKRKNAEDSKKVFAAARECGVPDKELQTDFLAVDQRWDDWYKKQKLLGYVIRNSIVITLSDPARLEELVSKLLVAGAVSINGIDFQTSELKRHRERARELALKAAREKAEKMAAVLGESVGAPIEISEIGGAPAWSYSSSWWGYGRSPSPSQNVVQNATPSGDGPSEGSESVALGKISVRAAVSVTFELRR